MIDTILAWLRGNADPVLAGVVATGLWTLLLAIRELWRLRAVRKLKGSYVQEADNDEPSTGTIVEVRKVEGNVLHLSSVGVARDQRGAGPWEGTVEMSSTLPTRGVGHDRHTETDGWGFLELQRVGANEILVQATFSRDRQQRTPRYVWRRQGSPEQIAAAARLAALPGH